MKKHYYKKSNDFYLILFVIFILSFLLKISRWKIAIFIEFIGVLLYYITIKLVAKYKLNKYTKSSLREIDKMEGVTFEKYLYTHFTKMGYKVKLTAKSNDYGADLILMKNGQRTVVQAKRYKNKVGIAAIQQIVAAKAYYKASQAMVITNSFFTDSAKNLAKKNGVILWDRTTLIKKFNIETAK